MTNPIDRLQIPLFIVAVATVSFVGLQWQKSPILPRLTQYANCKLNDNFYRNVELVRDADAQEIFALIHVHGVVLASSVRLKQTARWSRDQLKQLRDILDCE